MAKEFYRISAHSQTSVAAMRRRPAVHQQNKAAFFLMPPMLPCPRVGTRIQEFMAR